MHLRINIYRTIAFADFSAHEMMDLETILRVRLKHNAQWLARTIHANPGKISQWKRGEAIPSPERVQQISRLVGAVNAFIPLRQAKNKLVLWVFNAAPSSRKKKS